MISEFSLTNFKAFAGEQRIKLKPITLIYGPNSSGKSSLLQSLLLLKQTLESSEDSETLLLPKGNLVDLGGYREFINAHDVSKPFAFELRFPLPMNDNPAPGILGRPLELLNVNTVGLRFELAYDHNNSAASLNTVNFFSRGTRRVNF